MQQNKDREIDFDDGHKPGGTTSRSKVIINEVKVSSKFVSIFDGVLDEKWCQRAYQYSLSKTKPWGVYISACDALDVHLDPDSLWESDPERAIALTATRELLLERGKGLLGDDIHRIAGTAVWCLSSAVGDAVQYHIDYAELYRYETNFICPPLYAGTYHVTPFKDGDIRGGDFRANLGGLEHYKRFGYKGRLLSAADLEENLASSSDWISVPYRFNRGIIHDGDLPHMSTPIVSIAPCASTHGYVPAYCDASTVSASASAGDSSAEKAVCYGNDYGAGAGAPSGAAAGMKMNRVILGFNCFPQRVHDCCQRAPEHSDAFNRTIKLYQTMAALGISDSDNDSKDSAADLKGTEVLPGQGVGPRPKGTSFSVKDVLRNPSLARLLVSAAKKVTEQRSKMQLKEPSAVSVLP